jgi:ABC-type glycerol-3-phosphate transport system substrate-binding protein
MVKKTVISRRDFLRASALTAAGLVAAGCGAPATQAPSAATEAPAAATEAPAAEAPVAEEVTLDVMQIDEYEGQYEEIWSVYEAQNPGTKINVFPLNEDMAAAHNAKVAGGYLPAIELTTTLQIYADTTNYETFYDLSKLDFPWWDRWTWDVQNTWSDMFGMSGPRTLEIFQGIVITWMWRTELMDKRRQDL